jgi:hypothetical protein
MAELLEDRISSFASSATPPTQEREKYQSDISSSPKFSDQSLQREAPTENTAYK